MWREACLLVGLMACSVAGAVDPTELLPSALAFHVEAVHAAGDQAYVTFEIAPGYALYRDKIRIDGAQASLRFVQLPHGVVVHDDYLGDREEWRYRAIATIGLPKNSRGGRITIHLQGCADLGVCFNPEVRDVLVK